LKSLLCDVPLWFRSFCGSAIAFIGGEFLTYDFLVLYYFDQMFRWRVTPQISEVFKNHLNSKEKLSAISASKKFEIREHLVEIVQYYERIRWPCFQARASALQSPPPWPGSRRLSVPLSLIVQPEEEERCNPSRRFLFWRESSLVPNLKWNFHQHLPGLWQSSKVTARLLNGTSRNY
jgi:hypothetical protein